MPQTDELEVCAPAINQAGKTRLRRLADREFSRSDSERQENIKRQKPKHHKTKINIFGTNLQELGDLFKAGHLGRSSYPTWPFRITGEA